jgi:gamma-glutamyltranspeptidase / glutathione hydrolase
MNRTVGLALIVLLLWFGVAQAAPLVGSVAESRHGMAVSAHHLASEVGANILKSGGNAIDAAVAVGYALAVVDPCCGNIGGGGFMLIRLANGSRAFVNFREKAPRAARRDMYLDASGAARPEASLYGYLAAGVPGTVMGLDHALRQYGRLDRARVMAPAIALARDGFTLGEADAAIIASRAERLARDREAARIFLRPDGTPHQPGDRLVQPDLAATLTLIAARGPEAFYRGPIAEAVEEASAAHGGVLTKEDFADYDIAEAEPVACAYRGFRVYSAPPPSAGGTVLCLMLQVFAGWDLGMLGYHSPRTIHLMAETMRRAFIDRNTAFGDPDFVPDPSPRLLAPGHAAAIRAAIDPGRATPSAAIGPGTPPREPAQTTHYSIVDSEGNAVAATYTLNGNFGAAVVAPGTGFLLNNEMDDFTVKPGAPNLFGLVQGAANAIAPGKRPLSSMTPTIVERDGRPVLVLGSPGGPRIITAVLETIVNIVDFGLSPPDAVAAPRFHHQWLPDVLYVERGGFPPETLAALTERGHRVEEQRPWGAVALIATGPDGMLLGVSDPRRPAGAAVGY